MEAFINSMLERLLSTSVHTALVGSAVWMICRYVPRLSPAAQCWLWWLVALQILVGLTVSPIELAWLPQAREMAADLLPVAPGNTVIPDMVATAPVNSHFRLSWQSTAFIGWIAGSLIVAWFTLRDWRRGNSILKGSTPCGDERLLQGLAQASRTCGLRSVPMLRVSADIDSPLLIGHARPTVLLPFSTSLSDEELDMALIHELTHLHRGDLWLGFIPALARHLFFFHPVAHLALREYGIAREAACDAVVVNSGHRSRQNYGSLLVRLGASPELRAGLAVGSPTFHALKRRLTMLQRTSFLPRALSGVMVTFVAITCVMPFRAISAPAKQASTEERAQLKTAVDSFGKLNDQKLKKPLDADPEMREQYEKTTPEHDKVYRESEEYRRAIHEALAAPQSDSAVRARMKTKLEKSVAELRRTKLDAHPDIQFLLEQINNLEQSNQQINGEDPERSPNEVNARTATTPREEPGTQPGEIPSHAIAIAELEKRLAELQLRYKDAHPEFIHLRAQLRELQANALTQMSDAQDAYRIGRGDILQISVWQNPDLSVTAPVRPDGRISAPLVKDMTATGKTTSQLARDIETVLAEFIRAPKVSVILKSAAFSGAL